MVDKAKRSTAKVEAFRSKLIKMKPKDFADCVRLAGLSHATVLKFRRREIVELGAGKHELMVSAYDKLSRATA